MSKVDNNIDVGKNIDKLFNVVKNRDNSVIYCVNELVKNGVDINAKDKNGETVLMLAIKEWMDVKLVKELIKLGADVNVKDKDGNSLLFKVLEFKHDVVYKHTHKGGKMEMEAVVDKSEPDFETDNLNIRVWENGTEMIEMLVKQYKMDINVKDNMGDTLLHKGMQSMFNAPDMLLTWLVEELKSDVNIKDAKGNTALHYAVKCGCNSKSFVKMMLNNGGDPNVQNNKGKTPLHYAVKNGNKYKDMVELMMAKGGDIDIKNNDGESVMSYISKYKTTHLVSALFRKEMMI